MSDRIKKIKVKKADGSMTDYIPIGVDAENVDFDNGYKLDNIVGSINPDESGSIAAQLSKSIKYYDCVADMKADTTLNGGGAARTLGYYEPGDGGGAIYNIVEDNTLVDDGGSVHDLDNGLKAKLVIENEVNVKQFGAYGDNIHDDIISIRKAVSYCGDNMIILFFPGGDYKITDEITLTKGIEIKGIYNKTYIYLSSEEAKVCINAKAKTTFLKISNIFFDGVNKLHTGLRIAGNTKDDTLFPDTYPNWKNSIIDCQFYHFNVGLLISTDRDPLNGLTQNFASENIFLHCKFKNNHTHAVLENVQSFNNLFSQVDFENETWTDSASYPMIINRAGGGFTFDTCSMMGKGILYDIDYPEDGINLFAQHEARFLNCRLETYSNHQGNIFYDEGRHLEKNPNHNIIIENMSIYQHQSNIINLLNYVGKINCSINNLNLKMSPLKTINIESNTYEYQSAKQYEEFTGVIIKNVIGTVTYTTGNRYTGGESFAPHYEYRNVSRGYIENKDSQNFRNLCGMIDYSVYGQNYYNNTIKDITIIQPNASWTLGDQGFILPGKMMLLKFFTYKQGSRYDTTQGDQILSLYMVKNNNLWVDPTTLDLSTDALKIAEITAPYLQTGYFETPIVHTTRLGLDTRTRGIEDYSEGRYYITINNSNKTAGAVGIIYI